MKQKAAISGSIGLLTSVVIAILALVRGPLDGSAKILFYRRFTT